MPYGFFLFQKQAFGHVDMATYKGKHLKRYFKGIGTLVPNLYNKKMSLPPTFIWLYFHEPWVSCEIVSCEIEPVSA